MHITMPFPEWKLLPQISQTRRMAIANGTCVSFCNQPKAQFGYQESHAIMSLPSLVLQVEAFGYVKRVYKAHFGLP